MLFRDRGFIGNNIAEDQKKEKGGWESVKYNVFALLNMCYMCNM